MNTKKALLKDQKSQEHHPTLNSIRKSMEAKEDIAEFYF